MTKRIRDAARIAPMLIGALLAMALSSSGVAAADDESAFSTKPIPMKTDKELPARTPPIRAARWKR